VENFKLDTCLSHLAAAEAILEDAGDAGSLAHLSLVIDMLRRAHGLPDRIVPSSLLEEYDTWIEPQ
jgi:hypothetical protein